VRRLFAELPKVKTVEDFEALLPFISGVDSVIGGGTIPTVG
jgi:hypothetical protein